MNDKEWKLWMRMSFACDHGEVCSNWSGHLSYLLLSFHFSFFSLKFNLNTLKSSFSFIHTWMDWISLERDQENHFFFEYRNNVVFFFSAKHSSQLTICVYLLWLVCIITHLGHCSIRSQRTPTTTKLDQRMRWADEIRMKIGSIIVHILNAIRQDSLSCHTTSTTLMTTFSWMPHSSISLAHASFKIIFR